jgi:hypothetical protein
VGDVAIEGVIDIPSTQIRLRVVELGGSPKKD